MTWDTPTVTNLTSTTSSFSIAHTVGSGINRCAWMLVYSGAGIGGEDISGTPTFGGVGVGTAILDFNGNPLFATAKCYRQIAPVAGSNNFAGNFAAATNYTIVIISASDIDQITPNDPWDTDTTFEDMPDISASTPSAVNDEVVDWVITGFVPAAGFVEGGGQTEIANHYNNRSGVEWVVAVSRKAGAATVTQTWDIFAGAGDVGSGYQFQMNVNASPTAPPAVPVGVFYKNLIARQQRYPRR